MEDLERLQKAIENTEGKTPQEVLDAFMPVGRRIGDHDLLEVKYGHCLFLESFDHPLLKGETAKWTAQDLGVALFTFTRSSEELFEMVQAGTVEKNLYQFLESIPASKHKEYATEVIFHYYRSMNTAVAMESKGKDSPKKKIHSVGFWQGLRQRAGSIIGLRTS